MSNIVNLTPPPVKIWVCNCGCTTFELASDGTTTCAACFNVSSDHGGWAPRPEQASTVPQEGQFRSTRGNDSVDFARRFTLRKANAESACVIMSAIDDGSISVWANAETSEQIEWAVRRLEDAVKVLRAMA